MVTVKEEGVENAVDTNHPLSPEKLTSGLMSQPPPLRVLNTMDPSIVSGPVLEGSSGYGANPVMLPEDTRIASIC